MYPSSLIISRAPYAAAAVAVIALCSAMAYPHGAAPSPAPYGHNVRVAEYLLVHPDANAPNATIADGLGS